MITQTTWSVHHTRACRALSEYLAISYYRSALQSCSSWVSLYSWPPIMHTLPVTKRVMLETLLVSTPAPPTVPAPSPLQNERDRTKFFTKLSSAPEKSGTGAVSHWNLHMTFNNWNIHVTRKWMHRSYRKRPLAGGAGNEHAIPTTWHCSASPQSRRMPMSKDWMAQAPTFTFGRITDVTWVRKM